MSLKQNMKKEKKTKKEELNETLAKKRRDLQAYETAHLWLEKALFSLSHDFTFTDASSVPNDILELRNIIGTILKGFEKMDDYSHPESKDLVLRFKSLLSYWTNLTIESTELKIQTTIKDISDLRGILSNDCSPE